MPVITLLNKEGGRDAASWSAALKRSFLVLSEGVKASEMMTLSESLESLKKFMLRRMSLSFGSIKSILPSN